MNYVDIFNIIAQYYPIGISKSDPIFRLYNGSKLIDKKVQEVLSSDDLKSKWKRLIANLKEDFPELLNVTTDSPPISICYSAELFISERKIGNITHIQKLHCHLSYLAPFFCIYGKDEMYFDDNIKFDPIITVSPIRIFENYFLQMRKLIEAEYLDVVFLPFGLLDKRVKSLKISLSDLKEYQYSSVFQALFSWENLTDFKTVGNKYYK